MIGSRAGDYVINQTMVAVAVATIVAAALVITAVSAYRASIRTKRKDTLEAWNRWLDDTSDARRNVSRRLGTKDLSQPQAHALLGAPGSLLKDQQRTALGELERRQLRNDILDILNGLESLAAGVRVGVYDVAVIRVMGRSIIARTYKRFERYITAMREEKSPDKRQPYAFTEVAVLYLMMERRWLNRPFLSFIRSLRKKSLADSARWEVMRRRREAMKQRRHEMIENKNRPAGQSDNTTRHSGPAKRRDAH